MVILSNVRTQQRTVMHPIPDTNLTDIAMLLPLRLPQPAFLAELAGLLLAGRGDYNDSGIYEGSSDVADVDDHQGHELDQAVGAVWVAAVLHDYEDGQGYEVQHDHQGKAPEIYN